MNVEEFKAELTAIPEEILSEIVGPLMEIEDKFERHYIHFKMRTHGITDPGGRITETLGLLAQAKQDTADLIGYEDRVRTAIQSYVSGL
ncbi:hypothetical protein [Saccharopolyspora phatthalungensis]|uniref:Uncharacterized protein n=1 Tax=Saccharopolyspora phatthalungensis TaxID=664693 RepID=A0A840QHC9_9PSEU|nr:hypothetical protein [Saccharopolyspora phatthalungensis]MBB5159916.1 hypothetical protein [Saccharopolyspora phatthalungensis]